MSLSYLFNTPSSFETEPWGFARNAAGHALIVGALPAFLWPALIPVALGLYAMWEVAQWRLRRAEIWDCFHDWSYVAAGALSVLQPLILVPLVSFYIADIARRT